MTEHTPILENLNTKTTSCSSTRNIAVHELSVRNETKHFDQRFH